MLRRLIPFVVVAVVVAGCVSSSQPSSASNAPYLTPSPSASAAPPSAAPSSAAPSSATPSASANSGWLTVTPPDGSFTADFPATPQELTKSYPVDDPGPMSLHSWSALSSSGSDYIVVQWRYRPGTWNSITDAARTHDLDDAIDIFMASITGAWGSTVSGKTDTVLAGQPARTVTAATTAGDVHEMVAFMYGDDVYLLDAMHQAGGTAETDRFFDSFRLPQ